MINFKNFLNNLHNNFFYISGVYKVVYKNMITGKELKLDLLVMENLFYQRNISYKFDLKGSIRNRLADTKNKKEEVKYFYGNFKVF